MEKKKIKPTKKWKNLKFKQKYPEFALSTEYGKEAWKIKIH